LSGLYVQSFTLVGRKAKGTPIKGYVKVDRDPILSKQVEAPDFTLVFDPALVEKTLKEGSILIVNAPNKIVSDQLRKKKIKTYSLNATEIALNAIKADMPNTAMLGAAAKLYSKVSMKGLRIAIESDNIDKANLNAVEEGYRSVK
jgi:2-oxoacid:acceptor oxidoreductase gamma subunit (pyruvate/2-ketoisovalerate family)